MIATLLGADLFKQGMNLYFDRHDGQAVTIEDFVACFAEVSKRDLTQFSLWYHQAGTPLVSVSTAYDAARPDIDALSRADGAADAGPECQGADVYSLRIGLLLEDGSEAKVAAVSGAEMTGDVLHLVDRTQTVVLSGIVSRRFFR